MVGLKMSEMLFFFTFGSHTGDTKNRKALTVGSPQGQTPDRPG